MQSRNPEQWLLPTWSLWRREVVRFLRQRSRVVGALATPLVLWLVMGSGFGRSFQLLNTAEDTDYRTYFFPGAIVLVILFTAIFSNISIIEDRREGFMQAVLAAPVRRAAIVWGKVLGSTTLAVGQALLFLLLAPLAGVPLSFGSAAAACAVIIVVAVGLSGLGFLVAWPMSSVQGFHAVMNLFLTPMWFASGAVFPLSGAQTWMEWLMRANPLTYGVSALRHALYLESGAAQGSVAASFPLSFLVAAAFAGLTVWFSVRMVTRRGTI